LIWHLTEGRVHATDVTNASRTMLFNIQSCRWDEELLRIFEVPVALLPEVRPSAGSFGTTRVRTSVGSSTIAPRWRRRVRRVRRTGRQGDATHHQCH
jgi:glycerol kinase